MLSQQLSRLKGEDKFTYYDRKKVSTIFLYQKELKTSNLILLQSLSFILTTFPYTANFINILFIVLIFAFLKFLLVIYTFFAIIFMSWKKYNISHYFTLLQSLAYPHTQDLKLHKFYQDFPQSLKVHP